MNHADIIAGCKKGDRRAQKNLFEIYSKGMLSLCRRYVKDGDDAEELLLNGFYKFFSTIGRFEYIDDLSVGAWLKKTMVNECLMFLRKTRHLTFALEEYTEQATLDEDVFEKMNADAILQLIGTLPDGYRIVLNMYVIEGYGHKEIAAVLDISEGGSRSQLSRAKICLQKMLKENEIVL